MVVQIRYRRACACLASVLLLVAGACVADVLQVIYPRIEERPQDDYGYQVLELALAKSGVAYSLRFTMQKMNQERARQELELGTVSVVDQGPSAEFESRFDAVYFPINRGLSGYRLFIINQDSAPAFQKIRTLADLQRMIAGQGPGWSDTAILEASGIRVVSAEFESLFRMVDARRFDFFPLGVEEVYGFLERYRLLAPHSIVEESVALYYPFSRLFFVRKGNAELRDTILLGLKRAFSDGSFQRLLESNPQFKHALDRAMLKKRTLIKIDNPSLTERFREIPSEYFYRP